MKQIIVLAGVLVIFSCRVEKPSFPTFSILLLDSKTIINSQQIPTGQPILFYLISTDCDQCKAEVTVLLQHITVIPQTRIYLVTEASLQELAKLDSTYHLSTYANITVGQDYHYSFLSALHPDVVPYIAIYNSRKKLSKIYKGNSPFEWILKAIQS